MDTRNAVAFLEGGGEMGARMRAFDWAATALGAPDTWPQSLRTVVRLMLHSRCAMWMLWGPDLTLFCNDACLPTFGIRRDGVLGARADLVWAEIRPDIGPRIDHVLRTGEAARDERLLLFPERSGDPEETCHTFSYSPVHDDAGHVAGMLCVVTEDTLRQHSERRIALPGAIGDDMVATKTEAALRESEERFRTMADSSPLMVWVVDAHGQFEFVNRAVLECFGTTLDALRRDGWTPHLHPEDAEGYAAEVTAALAERRSFSVMGRVRRCDGEWRWIQSVGAPRLSADGEFLGAVGSSPDITELITASDTLRETDRRKDEFLATLAHELRNPLAPIRQAARLAQSETATAAQRRWSQQVIERQVRHMALLLDDLLDVSRITRGRLELRRQRVKLARIIEAALETARPLLDERKQALALELPVAPVLLDADPLRLSQVISNLLANAAKYSEPGGRVVLRTRTVDGWAEISVRDTGVGIEAEALPRIFEMFAQAKSSLDRAESGLGIGLALVKGLVELHGGTVQAHSEGAGKGALFVVRLPLPTAIDAAERDDRTPAKAPPAQRMRILVADDNRDAAASLATLLELDGHEVAVAHDGESALESAAAWRPHVALLDIGMPKRNGYEVARHIRAAPWGQAMKLVAVTGWGQAEDKRRAREAGFDRHFTKPLDLDALGAFLGDAVGTCRDS